jgi:hypothetical protein
MGGLKVAEPARALLLPTLVSNQTTVMRAGCTTPLPVHHLN